MFSDPDERKRSSHLALSGGIRNCFCEQSGFTLIEQLLVMTLIVAVLGFGGLRMMQTYQQNSESHAEKNLSSVLRFLQMKAIEDGRIFELSVSQNGKGIVVKRQSKDGKNFEPLRVSWLGGFQLGRSLHLQMEHDPALFFYPDGSASKNRLALVKTTGERTLVGLKNRIGGVEITHA